MILTKYLRDLRLKPLVFSKWSTSLPGVAVGNNPENLMTHLSMYFLP